MANSTKIILAIAVISVIAVGGYFIYKSYYPSYQMNPMTGNNQQTGNVTTTENQVVIKNFSFNPNSLTVTAGTTVTWDNQDSAAHRIASDTNLFNSADLSMGQTYQYTFQTPGTYKYHCGIHTYMTGEVIVK